MGCCQTKSSRVETFDQNGGVQRGSSPRTDGDSDHDATSFPPRPLPATTVTADGRDDFDQRRKGTGIGHHVTASETPNTTSGRFTGNAIQHDDGSKKLFSPNHHLQQHQVTPVDDLSGPRHRPSASVTSRLSSPGQGLAVADDCVSSVTTTLSAPGQSVQCRPRNSADNAVNLGVGCSDGRTCGCGGEGVDSDWSGNGSAVTTNAINVSHKPIPTNDRPGLRKSQSRLTASQIEFFRMVDEKIASGRDYESSSDGR